MSSNIVWHEASISKQERREKNKHQSFILWFTGLSASGKSSVANAFARALFERGNQAFVLDGDNIRHGLNKDLGFGETDRKENIRRIGEVSKLFVESGQIVLTAFISPYRADRDLVRELVEENEFLEVYIKCSVEECEKRDPKGLYKKARNAEISNFTGISAPYEEPLNPEVVLDTEKYSIEECVVQLTNILTGKRSNLISASLKILDITLYEKCVIRSMCKENTGSGKVYLVGAGPADEYLITLKAIKCIQQADVILYDRVVNQELLSYAKPGADLINCGKMPDYHLMKQETIHHFLIRYAKSGKIVTRLKGGDPFVFGRGAEEAEALVKQNIPFEIVPGVTSGIAAAAYAGIPVTHRDVSSSVAFVTGHHKNDEKEDEKVGKLSQRD